MRCLTCISGRDPGKHIMDTHNSRFDKRRIDHAKLKHDVQTILEAADKPIPATHVPPKQLLDVESPPPLPVQPFGLWSGFRCTTCRRGFRTEKSFKQHVTAAAGDGRHPSSYNDCLEEAHLQRFSRSPGSDTFICVRRRHLHAKSYPMILGSSDFQMDLLKHS
jgi:hypothetical protein